MNTLQTIQKTFRIFHVLAKIAFIFSIVGAALCAVGALCSVTGLTGGNNLILFGEPISSHIGSGEINYVLAALLSDMVILISDSILLGFTGRYLALEQAEGTPFTENGANTLRRRGSIKIEINS